MTDNQFSQEHAELLARVDEKTAKIEYDLRRLVEHLDRITVAHDDLVLKMAGTVMLTGKDHLFVMEQAQWISFIRGNLKWFWTALASATGAIVLMIYNWIHSINWGLVKK